MTFRVTLSETAIRQLRKLSGESRRRITRSLRFLEEDPFRSRPKTDIMPIKGTEPVKYRLRVGDYRVVYIVVRSEVKVIEIFVRGRGYR